MSAARRLGIDASNLRGGGGLTHLVAFLEHFRPDPTTFEEVTLWGGRATLDKLPSHPWLRTVHEAVLDRALPYRARWQVARLPELARERCDVLFCPGGGYPGAFRPYVTMCRNMLPWEPRERARYGLSTTHARLLALRYNQARSFERASGLIFLTDYARSVVTRQIGIDPAATRTIPHGVGQSFRAEPRPQRALESCSPDDPFRLLYVSIVDVYKHAWVVCEAVGSLRARGVPVSVRLVGPSYPAALRKLRRAMARFDPDGTCVEYAGPLPHAELGAEYRRADAFVFASSCENMPNILLEAMAAGLPVACSSRGPMPEVLGDDGVYFDPESTHETAEAIARLAADRELRERIARGGYRSALRFTWDRCVADTTAFLREVSDGFRA